MENEAVWSHLRVNLYPDGGIARLRVFGEARPEKPASDKQIDLVSLLNGGQCLGILFIIRSICLKVNIYSAVSIAIQ